MGRVARGCHSWGCCLVSAGAETTWTEGIVLRYGAFYGPGTSIAPGEDQVELVRRRKFPVVGDGGGVWSFIHVADAAEATAAARFRRSRGRCTDEAALPAR